MLNKNDPLIGAVQEVMKKNQAERDAVRLVNEKFGVADRKALPHERQGEWDAAYQSVLNEGVESLDEARLPKPPSSVKAVLALGTDERKSRAAAHKAEAGRHEDVYRKHWDKGTHGTPAAQKALDRSTHHEEMSNLYRHPKDYFKNESNKRKEMEPGVHTMDEEALNELSPETLENYKDKRTTQVHATLRNMINNWQRKKTGKGASNFIKNSAEKAAKHAEMIKLAGDKIDRKSEEALDEKLVGKQSNIDVASPDGSKKPDGKLTKHDFDALRASKNNTVKEAVINKVMKKLEEKKMTKAEMAEREKNVKSMKPVSNWEKRYPGRGEEVMYATATKQAMKEDKEGFNDRHDSSVTASAEKQVVAELYAVPGTPAGKAYSGALASNVGKPALPLQAGQRNLSPIGDSSRGRVRKTISRFVRKPLTVDDQAKAAAKTAFNTAMPDPQMSGSGRLRPEVSKFNKYKLPYISTNKSDSTALRPGAQRGDERPLTAQPKGPSFERSGRGSAPSLSTTPKTGPSTSLDAPARTAPSVVNKTGPSTSLDAPARTAPSVPPKAPNQTPPRPTGSGAPATSAPAQKPLDAFQRRAIERNPIGSSGRSLAPGGGSLGVTVRQPPSTTPRRPPGTGREK